jgi:hypothetical protein
MVMLLGAASAWSQAKVFEGFYSIGGSRVALPKGNWELMVQKVVKEEWDVAVLRNSSETALIPFMTVRVTRTSKRWKQNGCDGERKLVWRERFGTKSSDMTNQCSLLYDFGTYAGFKSYNTRNPDGWWREVVDAFPAISTFENESFLVLENQVTVFGKRVLISEYFIRTVPLGSSTKTVREEFQAGQVQPIHTAIKDWSRELITASYDAFYEGKSPTVASFKEVAKRHGLERHDTESTKTASTAPAVVTASAPATLRWPNDPADPGTQSKLGWAYRRGTNVPVDYEHALELFKRSANQGSADGLGGLGMMYADGLAVPRDDAMALKLLKQASDKGNFYASSDLGVMYRDGRGVARNDNIAFGLFETAAKEGARWGQYNLGKMYREGRATAHDEALAAYWFTKASRQNVEDAKTDLALLSPASVRSATMRLATESGTPLTEPVKPIEVASTAPNKVEAKPAAATASAQFANRKALVMGNDKYQSVTPLNNAQADARALATGLTRLGYKVTLVLDANERQMKQAVRDFKTKVEGGDEVLFFYAGHGVQLGNANYLLPIDIKGDSEEQVKDEAIQLQRVLDDMQDKQVKFTLAVIDACRDNPFKGSGRAIGTRGLAPTTAATGQMIIFSAGSGQQALDKLGGADKDPNSVFTRTFIKEMEKPGLTVDRVLRNVRNQVVELAKSVGHQQVPALYDQVVGDFYFKP